MHRKFGALFALLAAGLVGALALTLPASADTGWTPRTAGVVNADGAEIVDAHTVRIFSGNNSLENDNLGVTVAAGDTVTFHYELHGQTCGGGAPRVFVKVGDAYHNTFDHASTCADGDVSYTLSTGGEVTHAGVVNDKDHAAPVEGAYVDVSNLTIGQHAISFTAPDPDPSDDPSDDPSADPSDDPSADPSDDPSADPSTDPSVSPSVDPSASTTPPVKVTDGPDDLPTTGFGSLPLIIGSGAALVLSGAGILLLIARRRGWLFG